MVCPGAGRFQDFLEGLLDPAETRAMSEHVATCGRCAAQIVRLERVFLALDAMPLEIPSPSLRDRVMARVLPSRLRSRWISRLTWGYAGALAVSLAAIAGWFVLPAGRLWVAWLVAEASDRLLHSLMLVIHGASFLALSLSTSWGVVSGMGSSLGPLLRALVAIATHPGVDLALALATVSSLGVLWWIRARSDRSRKGVRHVGVLGI
jgi:hypothetical protein